MAISSKNLFHFTTKLEYLTDILKNGFWPRYCLEYGWGKGYDFALPMVCFCDIPLSQINEHSTFYGEFGIGVKPSWAAQYKEITPVQYVELGSNEFNLIKRLITQLRNGTTNDIVINILQLAKKVIGNAKTKKGKSLRKKFYDEREWRYVPSSIPKGQLLIPLKENEDFDSNEFSKSTEKLKLRIEPEQIAYIIIPSEHYREKMIEELKKIYDSKKQSAILHILISKIISLEQIKTDF